jgi:flavin-dependent dehydrogenase
MIDRAAFPRPKLCGDTVNPGTVALLARLGLADTALAGSLPVHGMIVSGAGLAVEGRYPRGLQGRALVRRDLDWSLLQAAIGAGATFEPRVRALAPLAGDGALGGPSIAGVLARTRGGARRQLRARVTIAADGRHSALAFALGLVRHPPAPRRWAIGAYFTGVPATPGFGEMHIRADGYLGIAPLSGGVANVCLVRPSHSADRQLANPAEVLRRTLDGDPLLRARFADARLASVPVVLGPLAVEPLAAPPAGLLLAGDAAGFVDPMTGDGLRFATRGGELAAEAALHALAHGWAGASGRLEEARRREFGAKRRFNRALRALVGSAPAVRAAGAGARLAPGIIRAIVARAGDCHAA